MGCLHIQGAAVGRLWVQQSVACVHVKCGQIGVFSEEVVDVDEHHGGNFSQ